MQKIYFYKTAEKKVRAIVIVPDPTDSTRATGKKYEYVYNSPAGINTFLGNMKRKFPAATHINFYCRKTGSFLEKIYLE